MSAVMVKPVSSVMVSKEVLESSVVALRSAGLVVQADALKFGATPLEQVAYQTRRGAVYKGSAGSDIPLYRAVINKD